VSNYDTSAEAATKQKRLGEILAEQSAPAVVTKPAPVPKAEIEQAKAEAEAMPLWERKVAQDEIAKKLDQIERTTGGSGAIPRMPKNMALDARDVQKRNPDLHIRWVNVNNTDKASTHVANGYERLPAAQGGRQHGNLVLMSIPQKTHLERRNEIRRRLEEWLAVDKQQYDAFLHGVARAIRDKYGISISPQQLGGIIRGD
jgi:hypothetical protein